MSPILQDLLDTVTRARTVDASATILIKGFPAKLDAAVAAAVANGATAAELAPVQALSDAFKSDLDDLASAVTANTPSAPTI